MFARSAADRTLVLAFITLAVLALTAGYGASGFVLERNPSPIDMSSNNVTQVNDVLVNEQTLSYDSGNVSSATVIVNNTGSELTLQVRVVLRTLDGVVVTEGSDSQVVQQGTATFTVDLDPVGLGDYSHFAVRVEPVDITL